MVAHELFFGDHTSWLGQGKIGLNISDDLLFFCSKWTISKEKGVYCLQEIEVEGLEKIENHLYFSNITSTKFGVVIKNELWGEVSGTGLIDGNTIAWEIERQGAGFSGLEVYRLNDDGQYILNAEYVAPHLYRSSINGKLWKTET